MHSVTDGRTDGQQDDVTSRSYCVAVRTPKNVKCRILMATKVRNHTEVFWI